MRAALRPARALAARPRRGLSARRRVRRRDAHDDRRRQGRARLRGGRARPRAPRHRPRPTRLPAPRPPARRPPARLRAAAGRTSAACGCRSSAGRRRRRAASRPVAAIGLADDLWSGPERGFRAHLARGPHDRHAQARRHPARRRSSRTRSVSGALLVGLAANAAQPARHPAGPRAQGVPALAARSPLGRRSGSPSCSLPTISARWRCSGDAGANALGALLGLGSVERLTGRRSVGAIGALAGLTAPRRATVARHTDRADAGPARARRAGESTRERRTTTKYVFVTGGVVSALGKGIVAASLGRLLKARGLQRAGAEVRPVPQRRSRHDEPVPARRGLRHRGRRRDRSRHRPLRALHRREPARATRTTAPAPIWDTRAAQGAPGRVPRRDGAGDPAHHERDQGAHPRGAAAQPTPTS